MNIHDISGSVTNNITSSSYTFNNTFNYKDSFNGDHINTGRSGGAAGGFAMMIVLALVVGAGYLFLQNAGLVALLAGGTYAAYRLDKAAFGNDSRARSAGYLEAK